MFSCHSHLNMFTINLMILRFIYILHSLNALSRLCDDDDDDDDSNRFKLNSQNSKTYKHSFNKADCGFHFFFCPVFKFITWFVCECVCGQGALLIPLHHVKLLNGTTIYDKAFDELNPFHLIQYASAYPFNMRTLICIFLRIKNVFFREWWWNGFAARH